MEFSANWAEWNHNYLKRHLTQKVNLGAVKIFHNRKHGTSINQLLSETRESRQNRNERKRSSPEQITETADTASHRTTLRGP